MTVPENFGQNEFLPPRYVPWLVRLRVLLGGAFAQFGWIFFGIGSIFFWIFGSMSDYDSWLRFGGAVETKGKITAVNATNASVNESDVLEFQFEFDVAETIHKGVSFSTHGGKRPGTIVTIEYVPSDPKLARIKGQRRNVFPGFVILFVAIFPGVGIGIAGSIFVVRIRALRLLTNGHEALGKLVSKSATGTEINDESVYKLTYAFDVDGDTYECVAKTHKTERLEDDELEPILYDKDDPSRSVALDSLPGMPRILADGSVLETRVFSFLVVPVLAVLANVVCLLLI